MVDNQPTLPYDIWWIILNHLDIRRPSVLQNLCLVSKQLNEVVTPLLYRDVYIHIRRKRTVEGFLQAVLKEENGGKSLACRSIKSFTLLDGYPWEASYNEKDIPSEHDVYPSKTLIEEMDSTNVQKVKWSKGMDAKRYMIDADERDAWSERDLELDGFSDEEEPSVEARREEKAREKARAQEESRRVDELSDFLVTFLDHLPKAQLTSFRNTSYTIMEARARHALWQHRESLTELQSILACLCPIDHEELHIDETDDEDDGKDEDEMSEGMDDMDEDDDGNEDLDEGQKGDDSDDQADDPMNGSNDGNDSEHSSETNVLRRNPWCAPMLTYFEYAFTSFSHLSVGARIIVESPSIKHLVISNGMGLDNQSATFLLEMMEGFRGPQANTSLPLMLRHIEEEREERCLTKPMQLESLTFNRVSFGRRQRRTEEDFPSWLGFENLSTLILRDCFNLGRFWGYVSEQLEELGSRLKRLEFSESTSKKSFRTMFNAGFVNILNISRELEHLWLEGDLDTRWHEAIILEHADKLRTLALIDRYDVESTIGFDYDNVLPCLPNLEQVAIRFAANFRDEDKGQWSIGMGMGSELEGDSGYTDEKQEGMAYLEQDDGLGFVLNKLKPLHKLRTLNFVHDFDFHKTAEDRAAIETGTQPGGYGGYSGAKRNFDVRHLPIIRRVAHHAFHILKPHCPDFNIFAMGDLSVISESPGLGRDKPTGPNIGRFHFTPRAIPALPDYGEVYPVMIPEREVKYVEEKSDILNFVSCRRNEDFMRQRWPVCRRVLP